MRYVITLSLCVAMILAAGSPSVCGKVSGKLRPQTLGEETTATSDLVEEYNPLKRLPNEYKKTIDSREKNFDHALDHADFSTEKKKKSVWGGKKDWAGRKEWHKKR